jgi:hypothetical protein
LKDIPEANARSTVSATHETRFKEHQNQATPDAWLACRMFFVKGLLTMRLAILFLFMLFCSVAHAEKRVALVIGNAAYTRAGELPNPRNDADDFAAALKALGVEVITGLDLDKQRMEQQLRKFSTLLSGADSQNSSAP